MPFKDFCNLMGQKDTFYKYWCHLKVTSVLKSSLFDHLGAFGQNKEGNEVF